MSEENVGTIVPGEGEEGSTQQPIETTQQQDPFVEKALQQGWRPKEEWNGDPSAWRSAKDFVERGELLGSISDLRKDNKEMREALQFLTEHHKKVKETEFTRALAVLKAEKKRAFEEGNADRVIQVEDAIDLVKQQQAQQQQAQPKPQNTGPTPVFLSWQAQNPWYVNDPEMKAFADQIGIGFFQQNPDKTEKEVYEYAEKQVKKAFADKFKGVAPKTPAVEGSTNVRASSKDVTKLPEEYEKIARTFERTGALSREEYIKELKRIGAI